MADSIVGGLFGMTPEMYQAQQNEQALAQSAQLGRLDPFSLARTGLIYGGRQMAGVLGGDSQLKLLSERNAIMRGVDTNDPDALSRAAIELTNKGDIVGAFGATQQAQTLRKQISDISKSAADTQKTLVETAKGNVDLLATTGAVQTLTGMGLDRNKALAVAKDAKLLEVYLTPTTQKAFELGKTGRYTPESLAQYVNTGNIGDLVELDKMNKPTTDWLGAARALQIDAKPKYADYSPEEAQRINQYLLNKDVAKNAAMRPPAQETAFAKTRGELQAKALQEATTNAQSAQAALGTLDNMERLSKSGQLYTGPFAMTLAGANNFLNSIGLLGKEQTRILANSEVYDKNAKDLVMRELDGKLGAQISEADRKFVEARIPQLITSPIARAELIAKLKEIQTGKIDAYKSMNTYANQYGNLNNFDFSQNYMPIQASQSPLAKPSGTTLSPLDQQALDWAKANPRDPRAKQIKDRLGVQ